VTGLRKSYGTVQAVRDVSFGVRNGEIVALLGPNGAGKTTTLEILEGFRARDGGAVAGPASIQATRRPCASCASGPGWSCRTSRSSLT
jgi:ABC-type multidrug transport system ATPase subunit